VPWRVGPPHHFHTGQEGSTLSTWQTPHHEASLTWVVVRDAPITPSKNPLFFSP